MAVVLWLRRSLRLHDNPSLSLASALCQREGLELIPLFVVDPLVWQGGRVGAVRLAFLAEALADLQEQFQQRRSRLFVREGSAKEALLGLAGELRGTLRHVIFEKDTEPEACRRDAEVVAALTQKQV
ncbi:unnamed protein product, partial [Polarella glacialis]